MSPLRGGILSGITLSGQRENYAGVRVRPRMNADERGVVLSVGIRVNPRLEKLQGSTTCEAGVDVVPPFEFVTFAELPTEQHDATVAK